MVSFSLTRAGENVAVVFCHCGVKMKMILIKVDFYVFRSVGEEGREGQHISDISEQSHHVCSDLYDTLHVITSTVNRKA